MRPPVLARERRGDGGPSAHHVAEDAEEDQIADHDAQRAAHERVGATPVAARPDVTPYRAYGRADLDQYLPPEQDECARDVESVREERSVARVRPAFGIRAADGQDRLLRLARQQVSAARPAVRQQADAGRVPALDLGAVSGRGATHHAPGLLLDPAERRDVLVGAEQDAGLARAGL